MSNIDHDALFKKLLTNFFAEFLELFLPQVLAYVDRSSIVALDKELFAAIGNEPNLEADVLMRANFKGKETWFIIHVEPQSYSQSSFARRMFVYFANLYLLYDKPIYPVALFTYDAPLKKADNRLQVTFPDKTVLDFSFEAIQLNRLDWHDYLNSVNPVALALMAKMNLAPEDYIRVKLECLDKLFGLGLTNAQENIIVEFVDTYMPLNKEQLELFLKELEKKDLTRKEHYMTFVNSWVQEGIERGLLRGREDGIELGKEIGLRVGLQEGKELGLQEGKELGLQEGKELGLQEGKELGLQEGKELGLQEGKEKMLLQLLDYRFGELEPEVQAQIKALPAGKIDALSLAMFDFKDGQDLLNWLTLNTPAIPPEETGTN